MSTVCLKGEGLEVSQALLQLQDLLEGLKIRDPAMKEFYLEGNWYKLKTLEKEHGVIFKRGHWISSPEVTVFGQPDAVQKAAEDIGR